MKKQMSLIVTAQNNSSTYSYDDLHDNTNILNELLNNGWTVVSANPMGGASNRRDNNGYNNFMFASLVILEKEE